LLPYEKILVGNLSNGERFETYVIYGEARRGIIELNGATGANAVDDAARTSTGKPVEVRGAGRLVGGAPLEDLVGTVREPVEKQDDDRVHADESSGSSGS
jgi:hypothetical protein